MTAGTVNGTLIAIYIGATKIDKQLDASLSLSHDPRTGINKDSGAFEEARGGKLSWEMSGEAEFAYDASEGFEELFDAWLARTEVTLEFTTAITGDTKYYGTALITKLETSAGVEEDVKFSYSFKGNGQIQKATEV